MLTEFIIENYKTFYDETKFSMLKAQRQTGLDYSLLENKIKGIGNIKVLSSSVIYGPNACGKTSIIGAMETLKKIIVRGNIDNNYDEATFNAASNLLELIPNNRHLEVKPVKFEISFIQNKKLYNYRLHILLGTFMDRDYDRKIIFEELSINNKILFTRNNDKVELNSKGYLVSNNEIIKSEMEFKLSTQLFVANGFRVFFDNEIVGEFFDWFIKKFNIIYESDKKNISNRYTQATIDKACIEKYTLDAAKNFGVTANALGYIAVDGKTPKLSSIFIDPNGKNTTAIPATIYESLGTIRFMNIFPYIVDAIMSGATIVIDEFDASIHPMALMNIINIFHNNEINVNHAQLIFNTHNPIFLNGNLFRRDEIKFVERVEDTECSIIYSLSDFGTKGDKSVRKGADYMNNYFVSQYGAIRDVDFTEVFEKLLDSNKTEDCTDEDKA